MSTGTAIEWTDATWSPITGCTRVSAELAGYASSGDTSSMFAKLARIGWAQKDRGGLRASDEFFT